MTTRHLTRLDDDNYEAFREQAHRSGRNSTELVNAMLRYARPLADAGVFNLPHDMILAAIEQHAERIILMAETDGQGANPQA